MKTVSLVGSTGSIGTQAIDVIRAEPGRYRVVALGRGVVGRPAGRPGRASCGPTRWPSPTRRWAGELAGPAAGRHRGAGRGRMPWPRSPATPTSCVNGVVGFAGLPVTLAALQAGRRLALANKESLIAGGPGRAAGPVDAGGRDRARRLRALRRPPVPAGVVGKRMAAADRLMPPAHRAHRQRRSVPGPHRDRAGRGDRRRRPGPSDLEDGSEDHRRLVHADEQGPRGHRGPRAVRRRLRPHRGGRAPAVDRALDGRDHRRRHPGPAVAARTCACRSATPWPIRTASATPFGAIDWATLGRLDFEAPDRDAFPCLDLAYQAGRAGRHGAGLAQRRQRGGRRRLPRRAHPLGSTSPTVIAERPRRAATAPIPDTVDDVVGCRPAGRDAGPRRASSRRRDTRRR